MTPTVPEKAKRPGVCYAVTNEGLELPVIDVTHPAFAVNVTPAQIDRIIDESMLGMRRGVQMPPEAVQAMAARSLFMRGAIEAGGTFVSGLITYLYKLGPDNLGAGYASDIDRAMAGGIMPLSMRLRLPAMARLIGDAVMEGMAARTGRVALLNIAGGAALDSLNALILIAKEHPAALTGRRISIGVLDTDASMPGFGARALRALLAADAPLHGVDATLEHVPYDWRDTTDLRAVLATIGARQCVFTVSSEGGLFEYASDEDLLQNLAVLRDGTPPACVMVGSIVLDTATIDPRMAFMETLPGRPAIRFLGAGALGDLAARAGWSIACCVDTPVYQVVSLRKS